jgi:hypothetical protein
VDIIQAIEDVNVFGSLFKRPETWQRWRTFLKGAFGLGMAQEEAEVFRRFTGRQEPPSTQAKEIFCISGRRSGKSFISALVASYLAVLVDWQAYLGPGEQAFVLCLGADMRQAAILLGYIKAIFELPALRGLVEEALAWELRLKNGIRVEVRSCSYRLLRGYAAAAVLADEACFWRVEGLNPAAEIFTSVRPMLATLPGSMLMVTSSPYSKAGPVWEAYRDRFGKDDPEVLVWRSGTRDMNETVPAEVVERTLREDYAAAQAEWLGVFRADLESYLATEQIEAVVIADRFELPRVEGVRYASFCDPSGGQRDAMTLAVAHKDEAGKVVLDKLVAVHPPFAPLSVVDQFVEVLKDYGVGEITADKYSGAWCSSAFEERGLRFRPSELSKSQIYYEAMPLIAQGSVELLDDRGLIKELRQLERRTGRGQDIIDHPAGLFDDRANAAMGALLLASKKETRPGRVFFGGHLVSHTGKVTDGRKGHVFFTRSGSKNGRSLWAESIFPPSRKPN